MRVGKGRGEREREWERELGVVLFVPVIKSPQLRKWASKRGSKIYLLRDCLPTNADSCLSCTPSWKFSTPLGNSPASSWEQGPPWGCSCPALFIQTFRTFVQRECSATVEAQESGQVGPGVRESERSAHQESKTPPPPVWFWLCTPTSRVALGKCPQPFWTWYSLPIITKHLAGCIRYFFSGLMNCDCRLTSYRGWRCSNGMPPPGSPAISI